MQHNKGAGIEKRLKLNVQMFLLTNTKIVRIWWKLTCPYKKEVLKGCVRGRRVTKFKDESLN